MVAAAVAKDGSSQPEPSNYENIFLGEVAPTNYAEVRTEPGVIGEVEVVRERYPDGKVRIERQVTLNGDGNYVDHGAWKQFSTTGDVVAEGQYNFGQRVGSWTRWIGYNDSSLLKEVPFKQFKAPFMSQANFVDGKMDGDWIITDANERKVLTVTFNAGQRNGMATTWLPNGNVYRQMTYHDSVPVGEMLEINPKTGELAKAATYDNGRKVITRTERYPHGRQMKSEIMYLAAKSVVQTTRRLLDHHARQVRGRGRRRAARNGQDLVRQRPTATGRLLSKRQENGHVYVLARERTNCHDRRIS